MTTKDYAKYLMFGKLMMDIFGVCKKYCLEEKLKCIKVIKRISKIIKGCFCSATCCFRSGEEEAESQGIEMIWDDDKYTKIVTDWAGNFESKQCHVSPQEGGAQRAPLVILMFGKKNRCFGTAQRLSQEMGLELRSKYDQKKFARQQNMNKNGSDLSEPGSPFLNHFSVHSGQVRGQARGHKYGLSGVASGALQEGLLGPQGRCVGNRAASGGEGCLPVCSCQWAAPGGGNPKKKTNPAASHGKLLTNF